MAMLGKRGWEPGGPPPGAPGGAASASEEEALQQEMAWLQQQNSSLQKQLSGLQQQHMALSTGQPMPALAPVRAPHDPSWTEQTNPENGTTYYWNSRTGESVYERPADYNPPLAQKKGPVGANLFVVRKMRRGDYDNFTDADLRAECSKFGTVLRAEMTIDKMSGMSKGNARRTPELGLPQGPRHAPTAYPPRRLKHPPALLPPERYHAAMPPPSGITPPCPTSGIMPLCPPLVLSPCPRSPAQALAL